MSYTNPFSYENHNLKGIKMTNARVLGLMLDLVVDNLATVPDDADEFVRKAMLAAKRKIADCNKLARIKAENEMAAEKARQPFNLGERARLV